MIQPLKSIYVKHISKDKGYGVFANEHIKEGELIETCYLINTGSPEQHVGADLMDYVFNYPRGLDIGFGAVHVIPTGYGCIYNHDDNHNAHWENSKINMCFDFIAIKDINPGEEICTYYGDHYWPEKTNRDEK